jgi:CBS domain-containing protein
LPQARLSLVTGALPRPTAPIPKLTPAPLTLGPDALGLDALHLMAERGIRYLPIVANGALVGILTQADLVGHEAQSAARLVAAISRTDDADAMAAVTARIPQLLAHLVAQGARPHVIARMITDIADAATRRLLALAEATLGAPPSPICGLRAAAKDGSSRPACRTKTTA